MFLRLPQLAILALFTFSLGSPAIAQFGIGGGLNTFIFLGSQSDYNDDLIQPGAGLRFFYLADKKNDLVLEMNSSFPHTNTWEIRGYPTASHLNLPIIDIETKAFSWAWNLGADFHHFFGKDPNRSKFWYLTLHYGMTYWAIHFDHESYDKNYYTPEISDDIWSYSIGQSAGAGVGVEIPKLPVGLYFEILPIIWADMECECFVPYVLLSFGIRTHRKEKMRDPNEWKP